MEKQILKEIDYKKVFYYFEEISSVPRGSRDNKRISDYLVQFAKERNLSVVQDDLENVVIIKEATKGYEHCDAVMLQGHMDMVCIKDVTSNHDFLKEGLELVVDGDFIHAKGTTLGGDNGIAIAMALAILDSDDYVHPRLEVVITTDEEIGLIGATGLDTTSLQAKYMINLDSEEETSITVGCAGGMTAMSELPLTYKPSKGNCLKVSLLGLQGGHSGIEAAKNRTNANLLMARMIMELGRKVTFEVAHMEGGQKDNAIPSEAYVTLMVADEYMEGVVEELKYLEKVFKHELQSSEPSFYLTIENQGVKEEQVLEPADLQKVLMFVLFQPNGVQVMSSDIEGLVESSLNLGIFKMNEKQAEFSYSVRSSIASYKEFMSQKLETLTVFLGGSYHYEGSYPAWEYKKNSKLRDLCVKIYKEEFQRDPIIETIHAGLECGIIAEKMPGIDIVSIGPDMNDVHTPLERLSISSTKRVFDYVVKILESICQ